jgi:hypothetical protein
MRPILFVAVMIGVACVLNSIDANSLTCPAAPESRSVLARLDRELLKPPPPFDCGFKANGVDSSQPQSDTEAAVRVKVDYELQCHRHAEMILRSRLRQLQAAARETVNSVNRTRAAVGCLPTDVIALPDGALLTPPAEFNCEFKAADLDDARAASHAKLDYELQCYRHAELIVRDRLQRLQASVGETIKAVDRSEQGVVKPTGPQLPQQVRQPQQSPQPQPRQGGRDLARALQTGGFVIVHRYTAETPNNSPSATAAAADAGQRMSPHGGADAQAMGQVYRRLNIPVAQVLSSEHFLVYQNAVAAFGSGVKLHRDLTGSRSFTDPAELERSLAGLRSRVATRPPPGTNVVLWTHEGKFKKAFGRPLPAGETVVFGPGSDGLPHEVARLSLKQFLALAH